MRIQLFILILIFATSCQRDLKRIGDYREVMNLFNSDEIKDLQKIVDFFSSAICESADLHEDNVLMCYDHFFKRMGESVKTGNLEMKIPYEGQIELLKELDPITFNHIWYFSKTSDAESDTVEIINVRRDGKYSILLKEMGKKNRKVNNYYEKLAAVGDISPSMVADVLNNYQDYDLSDDRIKLLIAIHYLTLNEQYAVSSKLDSGKNMQ